MTATAPLPNVECVQCGNARLVPIRGRIACLDCQLPPNIRRAIDDEVRQERAADAAGVEPRGGGDE